MKHVLALLVVLAIGQLSYGADCELTIDRKPCPGKEVETLKPYNGKNPTEEKKSLDAAACEKWAEKSSKIIRKGTLLEKKVSAKFDGKDLGKNFSDKSECK